MELLIAGTGSSGNCYLLRETNSLLMLDCGVSVESIYRAVNYNMAALAGCLVSHAHYDHSRNVDFLRRSFVTVPQAEAGVSGNINDWMFLPFELEHDTYNLGYIIQHSQAPEHKIAYITDTGYVRFNPQGISTYIIECNFIDDLLEADKVRLNDEEKRYLRSYEYHLSLKRLLQFLSKTDTSKLINVVLVHLSDKYSDEVRMVQEVSKQTGVRVYAAHNGDRINLDEVPF